MAEKEDYSDLILADLIREGIPEDDIPEETARRYRQIKSALEAMIADSEAIAAGEAEYETYEDVFGLQCETGA